MFIGGSRKDCVVTRAHKRMAASAGGAGRSKATLPQVIGTAKFAIQVFTVVWKARYQSAPLEPLNSTPMSCALYKNVHNGMSFVLVCCSFTMATKRKHDPCGGKALIIASAIAKIDKKQKAVQRSRQTLHVKTFYEAVYLVKRGIYCCLSENLARLSWQLQRRFCIPWKMSLCSNIGIQK